MVICFDFSAVHLIFSCPSLSRTSAMLTDFSPREQTSGPSCFWRTRHQQRRAPQSLSPSDPERSAEYTRVSAGDKHSLKERHSIWRTALIRVQSFRDVPIKHLSKLCYSIRAIHEGLMAIIHRSTCKPNRNLNGYKLLSLWKTLLKVKIRDVS